MGTFKKKAALLDDNGIVIAEIFQAPAKGFMISIAGAMTACGDFVNVQNFKMSFSKKNLKLAEYCQPVSRITTKKHGNDWVYTFRYVA